MPNAHDPSKAQLSLWVPRHLLARIRIAAEAEGVPYTQFLTEILTNAVQHVPLTAADYLRLAADTGHAERRARRNLATTRNPGGNGEDSDAERVTP